MIIVPEKYCIRLDLIEDMPKFLCHYNLNGASIRLSIRLSN